MDKIEYEVVTTMRATVFKKWEPSNLMTDKQAISKNIYSADCWIEHNLDEYKKQLDTVANHVQMLKNEIKTLEEMKLNIDFHYEEKEKEGIFDSSSKPAGTMLHENKFTERDLIDHD